MTFWDRLVEEARSLGETLFEWIILILIALVILVVGRWVIRWIRKIIERVLGAGMLDGIWQRSGISTALEGTDQTAASITATIVYAYLMVALWLIVARVVQLTTIEVLLVRLLAWIPLVVLAAVIVIVFAAVASWLADLVGPMARERGIPWLTWVLRVSVIVFGLLLGLEIIGVNFAEDIVKIVIAAAGVMFAIAFGVGGIDAAKKWWALYGSPKGGSGGGSSSSGSYTAGD